MIRRYDFDLTDEPDKDGFQPFMSACIPTMVICPGGGYECVCEYREGELHIYPKGGHGIQLTTQRILRSRSMFPREYHWHKMSVDRLAETFGL